MYTFRGIYTKKVSIARDVLSCSKKSIYYTNTDAKTGEDSTYQELDLSREETPYQNTIIWWLLQFKNMWYGIDCVFISYVKSFTLHAKSNWTILVLQFSEVDVYCTKHQCIFIYYRLSFLSKTNWWKYHYLFLLFEILNWCTCHLPSMLCKIR